MAYIERKIPHIEREQTELPNKLSTTRRFLPYVIPLEFSSTIYGYVREEKGREERERERRKERKEEGKK